MKYTGLLMAGLLTFAENRAIIRPTGCYKETITQYPAGIFARLLNGLQSLPIERVVVKADGCVIHYTNGVARVTWKDYPEVVKTEIIKIVSQYEDLL